MFNLIYALINSSSVKFFNNNAIMVDGTKNFQRGWHFSISRKDLKEKVVSKRNNKSAMSLPKVELFCKFF